MRIAEVRLATRDLAAQREFYVATLDLPLLEESADRLTIGAGATRLVFERAAGDPASYHVAFNIPENKLGAAKAWLAGRAALLTENGADEFASASWNARQVYFADQAGNILEFIARHDLANAAPGPFGPADVLNVSEVGLAVADVPAAVAALTAALGVAPYKEQGRTFAPIGDAHGLCIVVRRGRPWFPTDRGAEVGPIALTLAGARDADYRLAPFPYHFTTRASPPGPA